MTKKNSRISKSTPYSGSYPHREHRSKKGRKYNREKPLNIQYKKLKEKLHYEGL